MRRILVHSLATLLALAAIACTDGEKKSRSAIEKLARDRAKPATSAGTIAHAPKPTVPAVPVVPPVSVDSNELSKTDFPDEHYRALIWDLRKPNREKTLMKKLFANDKSAAMHALFTALHQTNPNIRTQAAKILVASKKKSDAVEGALLKLIAEEKDPDVLANVLSFIDSYRSKRIAAVLHEFLKTHENKMVRAYSAAALGTYRYTKAKKDVVRALRDPESWVRLMALGAMKKFKDRSTLPSIRPLLKDENDRVRKRAKETVKLLGG
jgi:HEAT repeat protein